MDAFWRSLLFLAMFILGIGFQNWLRPSPRINFILTSLIILILPPFWSFGLTAGIWLGCAFFTYNPELKRDYERENKLIWFRVFLSSLLTLAGFLMALLFLWKLKVASNLEIGHRETMAWLFLIVIELCLYRVIARSYPSLYRIQLGYGMAIFNFLMLLFWIRPLGIYLMLLIFGSLLIINPILLIWLDPPLPLHRGVFPGRR